VGGASTSTSSESNQLFYVHATLNGLDTIALSTQRIVENHCPWLLDELINEQDVLVRYGDINRAQRRQQNIDQQRIINVYLSHYNSDTKNVISPAAITKNVLKCGMIVTFLFDYRFLMRPLPLAAAAATRDLIDSEIFVSESYGTTNTNVNVTSLRSGDSSTQQQQIIVAATQKRKKKSRKSSHKLMALGDFEVPMKKKPKKNSKPAIQLPAASAAEDLTAQSSNPRRTLNLPSELQITLESAITAEQRKNTVEEPIVKHSNVTTHNNEVPDSTLIVQSTPPETLNIANRSCRRRAKTLLHPQQQKPAIDPKKAAPIAGSNIPEKSSVPATADGSTAVFSREDKVRKSSSQHKMTRSSQLPATTAFLQDLVVITTKLPTRLATLSEVALEAKRQKIMEDKPSNRKKETLNTPDDKGKIAQGSSSLRVINQPFSATSMGIHVPVRTPSDTASTAAFNIAEKDGTAPSVANSFIDVHHEGAVSSSNYKIDCNVSSTCASSKKSDNLSKSHGSINDEKHTSQAATHRSKNISRKASSEHEVPKKKSKTSAVSSPTVQQSTATSKFAVITEKRKNSVDEPPKERKRATLESLDMSATVFISQAVITTATQPSPLDTSENADISDGNRIIKDVPYPQQWQPKVDSIKTAPTIVPVMLVAAPPLIDSSASSGKERETCTFKDKAAFSKQASSTTIAQPSPLVTVMNANVRDSHKKDKAAIFLQEQQLTSNPLKAVPIASSLTAALSIIDSNSSTNKEGETFSTSNTGCVNKGTSGEVISLDSLTMLTKIQLKDLCKINQVPHSGSKKNLVDRLMKNSPIDKKQHSKRVTTNTTADSLKDVSLMSFEPNVNTLHVCSTKPQDASLVLNNLKQSMADKQRVFTKDINEEKLVSQHLSCASQHLSCVTTANDMMLSTRQIDRKDQPLKTTNTSSHNIMLSPFANDGEKNTPHPLVVIDEATYQKFKENTILLSNMQRYNVKTSNPCDGGKTTFSIENYGENICHIFKEINGCSVFDATCEIPFGYMFFMCRASEKCLADDPCVLFMGDEYKKQDYVILFLFVSDIKLYSSMDGIPVWKNLAHLKQLQKEKKSTIKGNKGSHHYGSTGQCFSFGVRSSFNADPVFQDVTLTNYAGDNSKEMIHFKKYVWQQFDAAFMAFDRILTGLSSKLNVGVKSMQELSKSTVLDKFVRTEEAPTILTASINVDCRTRELHCEKDITYTTIVVPIQEDKSSNIIFEFKVCHGASFQFCCLQSSCFTYSAYCLTHRQLSTNGTKCMNLSSYSNIKTYFHFRTSYIKIMKKKEHAGV